MPEKLYKLFNKPDFGLLLIRVVIGIVMVSLGVPKFLKGTPALEQVGSAMALLLGLTTCPVFCGFMAAFTETIGGVLFIVGFYCRLVSFLLAFVMGLDSYMLYHKGMAFVVISHPLSLCALFLGLLFVGAGKYSIDKR